MSRLCGIVLAAGASARMGRRKALLSIKNTTFVGRVASNFLAADVRDLVVVTTDAAAPVEYAVRTAAPDAALRVVLNPDPDRGQLSSLIVGLSVVPEDAAGVLVCPVDMPLWDVASAAAIAAAARSTGAPIARPLHQGRHGHPVWFSRVMFADLRTADPTLGARAVVRARASEALDVPVDDPGVCIDIDTPEDYFRYIGQPLPEAPRP